MRTSKVEIRIQSILGLSKGVVWNGELGIVSRVRKKTISWGQEGKYILKKATMANTSEKYSIIMNFKNI